MVKLSLQKTGKIHLNKEAKCLVGLAPVRFGWHGMTLTSFIYGRDEIRTHDLSILSRMKVKAYLKRSLHLDEDTWPR